MQPSVPTIFDERRRAARLARAKTQPRGATWLLDAMAADVVERLGFMRIASGKALISGLGGASLSGTPGLEGAMLTDSLPLQTPLLGGPFDVVVSLGELDTINDLPGTLIHLRHALEPGGLLLATILGAGSLPVLRSAMLAADGERPAARIHPQVDSRMASALLERAGFARQVVDHYTLTARYRALDRLVADMRDQALTSILADRAPPIGKAGLERANVAFISHSEDDGKTSEQFEILTLTAWKN